VDAGHRTGRRSRDPGGRHGRTPPMQPAGAPLPVAAPAGWSSLTPPGGRPRRRRRGIVPIDGVSDAFRLLDLAGVLANALLGGVIARRERARPDRVRHPGGPVRARQSFWNERARDMSLPHWVRVYALAYGRHRKNGYASFRTGDLVKALPMVDKGSARSAAPLLPTWPGPSETPRNAACRRGVGAPLLGGPRRCHHWGRPGQRV